VIKAQDHHLKAQVATGDETHREAHEAMRGRWKRPISGSGGIETSSATSPDCRTTHKRNHLVSRPHERSGPRRQQPRTSRSVVTGAEFRRTRLSPIGLLGEAEAAAPAAASAYCRNGREAVAARRCVLSSSTTTLLVACRWTTQGARRRDICMPRVWPDGAGGVGCRKQRELAVDRHVLHASGVGSRSPASGGGGDQTSLLEIV
jgi:hypothetical protein